MLIKKYYNLAKPGIVYGNLIAVFAGFFLATHTHFNLKPMIGVIVGSSLVIGSACVFNNYIDKDLDARMNRTKNRSLVVGEIKTIPAMIYGIALGIGGLSMLFFLTNIVTTLIGLIGFVFYVVIYGVAKRKTIYSTLIGSVAGALPPVAGYTAITNRIDTAALLLFLILTFWQMPHFYAIAIYRIEDYANTRLVLWPIKRGIESTKRQILFFIIAFIIACISLFVFHYKDKIYLIIVSSTGLIWIYFCIKEYHSKSDYHWAKKMFFFSLVSLLVVCFAIAI